MTVTQTVGHTPGPTPASTAAPLPAPTKPLQVRAGRDASDHIGTTNISAQRTWTIVGHPDEAVALARLDRDPAPVGCNPFGREAPTRLVVTGRTAGTTTVTVARQLGLSSAPKTTETVTYEVTVSG